MSKPLDAITGQADHFAAARAQLDRRAGAGKWGARLATAAAAYHLGQMVRQGVNNRRNAREFTVTVAEHDEVYDHVHRWLLDMLPENDQRALTAHTVAMAGGKVTRADVVSSDDGPVTREVMLAYDGTREHTVDVGGHVVKVRVEQDENSRHPGTAPDGRYSMLVKPRKVVFVAADVAGRQAVVEFLQRIADSLSDGARLPRVVMSTRWGSWGQRRNLAPRPLASVVLPDGEMERVLDDMRGFLTKASDYARMGVSWHRGYLASGPPGTGKTSMFRAIAGELGLDIYIASLSDLEADSGLFELVGSVPERSMLLLEDVDVVHAAKTRDDADRAGITLAGLLQAFDGVVTPPGLIRAMTTNHRDKLDTALLRRGRVDVEVKLGHLTPEQYGRLITNLTGIPADLTEHGLRTWPAVVPADVVGILVDHVDDPEAGYDAVLKDLHQRAQPTPRAAR